MPVNARIDAAADIRCEYSFSLCVAGGFNNIMDRKQKICFKFSVNVNDVHILWMKFSSDGTFDTNSLGNSNSRRCNLRRQVLREVACTIHMKLYSCREVITSDLK